ncbi:MAG: hypothetical protein BWX81_00029 [Spirochaetes bacterium ADurb.Bin110]|nr:MAG: hypothetical protein BWX81_00029 [Spirochaetes bacterium ADurb.Bin110]
MKRKAIFIILLILAIFAASAQTALEFTEVIPKDARTMGMGGAFRVFSQGYSSFFGNPAGFAGANSSLTLTDLSVWAYLAPTTQNVERVKSIIDGSATDSDILGYAADWIISNNGFGAGLSLGGGWVGKKGIAIGVTLVSDEVVAGSSLLGSKLVSATQLNGILGYAYPFNIGPVSLRIGLDGRAFYRVQSDPVTGLPFSTILNDVLNDNFTASTITLLGGYGFAADVGLVAGIGPVMLGLSARDFGLEFKVGNFTAQNIIDDNIKAFPLLGTTAAKLNPSYAAGLGVRLFENGKFEPSIYTELENPQKLFSSSDIIASTLASLHAGAQVRLLRFITVRGGLNKGWYSLGAGIDLSFLELDAAIFTEELGLYPGDKGRSGISVQVGIRFGR